MHEELLLQKGFWRLIFLFFVPFSVFAAANTESKNFAFAEVLYWEMREGSAENWGQIITSGAPQTIHVLSVPFKWRPGFRLGFGKNLQHDRWDTVLYYTRYQTKGVQQASTSSGGIYSPFLGNFFVNNTNGGSITAAPNYSAAGIKWKLFFNTLDLELGRKFKIDRALQMRPFIALKGGVINQHIFSTWNNPTNTVNFTAAVENLKNDFTGIGPAIGLDTTWHVYKGKKSVFNIFGSFSGALMFGHWRFSDLYQNDHPLSVAVQVSNINGACTMGRGLLGVEWSTKLGRHNTGIRIAYEIQGWFDQLQFYSYNMGRLNAAMYLQGGVIGFYFNF